VKIKVYGCKGSISTYNPLDFQRGSNTSCVTIESMGKTLIIDAGSGLAQYEADLKEKSPDCIHGFGTPVDILLSHLHLDHIIGLPVFSPCWNKEIDTRIFTCSRGEKPLKEQIFGAFVPPYWPLSMVESSTAECVPIQPDTPFQIGPYTVEAFPAAHANNTFSFFITDGIKTLVYLLDGETSLLDKEAYEKLVNYCKDADLVIFDAAYSIEDYSHKKSWGHSTVEDGFKLLKASNCKKMMFSHFGFNYTNQQLNEWEECVNAWEARDGLKDRFVFARDGLELEL